MTAKENGGEPFAHGQLGVAMGRVKRRESLQILALEKQLDSNKNLKVKNVVNPLIRDALNDRILKQRL